LPTSTPSITSITNIAITPSSLTIEPGKSHRASVITTPMGLSAKYQWKSSNTNVASVDNNGLIVGITTGQAYITVTVKETSLYSKVLVTVPYIIPTSKPTPTSMPTSVPEATPTKTVTEYKLVWSDEFNGTSVDTTKWTVATNCGDHWNNEVQCYTADAISVKGGNLVIKTERRKLGGFEYTSGLVKTDSSTFYNGKITPGESKFTTKYGKIEFRVQLPVGGQGVWPALWMIPSPYANPPEIDIIEAFSDMGNIYTNYWWKDASGNQQNASIPYKISNPSTTFHVFTLEWEPGVLRWYADGNLKRTLKSSTVTDVPMYILINTALGGNGGGYVGSSTSFPQYFLIDYVKVYQKR
jgi:beta-glucanase (GH16 family)